MNSATLLTFMLAVATVLGFSHHQSKAAQITVPSQPYAVVGARQHAPLVIYCHGAGGSEKDITAQSPLLSSYQLAQTLAGKGFIVAASNAHGNNWGNPQSVQDDVDLYNYLASKYRVSGVYVLGQSMGGLDCLQLVNRIPAAKFYGIYPVTQISSMFGSSYQPQITAAWGTDTPTLNIPLSSVLYGFAASYQDTVVLRSLNTDVTASQTTSHVFTCTGEHGDPSCFNASDVLSVYGH